MAGWSLSPYGVPPARRPPQLPSPCRLQGKPALQLPLTGSHPYDHITVESAFDNPTYETGVSNWPLCFPGWGRAPQGPFIVWAMCARGCVWGGTGTDGDTCSRNHAWDRTSIQGPCTGWDMIQRPHMGWDINAGTVQRMGHLPRDWLHDGHQSRDHTWDGTSTQGSCKGCDIHPGTTHEMGQSSRDHAQGRTCILGTTHQLGHLYQGPCIRQDNHPGTTHRMGHAPPGPFMI